jgi:hypothetical protein
MSIIRTLLPHALHLRTTWLEIPEILLAETRFFVDFDVAAREGRWRRVVGGQGGEDAFGGLPSASVGRGKEVEGVVGLEKGAQAAASFVGLGPAFGGELDTVIGDVLMDVAVFWENISENAPHEISRSIAASKSRLEGI